MYLVVMARADIRYPQRLSQVRQVMANGVWDDMSWGNGAFLSSRAQPRDLAAIEWCVVCDARCLDCAALRST